MKTGYYLDERASVIGGTLIRLNDNGEDVRVSSSYGGNPVSVLGSGAVVVPRAVRLTLEEGFRRLESDCMTGNRSLREIRLPATLREIDGVIGIWRNLAGEPFHLFLDRRMTAGVWEDIRQRAVPVGGKQYALSPGELNRDAMRPADALPASLEAPGASVQKEMRCVFLVRQKDKEDLQEQFFSKISCLDLKYGRGTVCEADIVTEMIRDGDEGLRHAGAEEFSDLMIRKNGKTGAEADKEVCLILCEPGPAEDHGGGAPAPSDRKSSRAAVTVRLHLFRQKAFFPSLRYVRSDDSDWWIYSRNYLTGIEDHPYIRMEMGVFNRQGMVTNREQAEAVYAKYRFISML